MVMKAPESSMPSFTLELHEKERSSIILHLPSVDLGTRLLQRFKKVLINVMKERAKKHQPISWQINQAVWQKKRQKLVQ